MGKAKWNGTRRGGQFIQRHLEWLDSAAYRDLTCTARCLLEELQILYRPSRNGRISLSNSNAVKRLKVNKGTVTKAFNELAEHGFIALTQGEYWQEGRAREWRLTFEQYNGHQPTDDWARWEPGHCIFTLPRRNSSKSRC